MWNINVLCFVPAHFVIFNAWCCKYIICYSYIMKKYCFIPFVPVHFVIFHVWYCIFTSCYRYVSECFLIKSWIVILYEWCMVGPVQNKHISCRSDSCYGRQMQFLFVIGQLRNSSLKQSGQINWNFAGNTFGRFCIKFHHLIYRLRLNTFYLLFKCAKRTRHKLNKVMKSSPIYNKLQHYLIEHACL